MTTPPPGARCVHPTQRAISILLSLLRKTALARSRRSAWHWTDKHHFSSLIVYEISVLDVAA